MRIIQKIRWKIIWTCGIALCIYLWISLSRKDTNQISTLTQNDASDAFHDVNDAVLTANDAIRVAPNDLPAKSSFTVQMRMNLNNTKHAYPWGEDKYNTQERCAQKKYDLSRLPSASVILCFHETEELEHLLHTVHSIIQNSPEQVLHEIILMQDNSHQVIHETYLTHYVSAVFNKVRNVVRIIRNDGPEQLGVIQCRREGILHARGSVVAVLDAHMEAREGWLEALLQEIVEDPRTLATVNMDWMKPQQDGHWVYEHGPSDPVTAWYWKMFAFTFWTQQSAAHTRQLEEDPTRSFTIPCTVGNWAMDRKFFWEIGGLDPGMQLWGGENIDLAIRSYLWNGRVVAVPCSHVAHLETANLRSYRQNKMDKVANNYKRVVEVWFDEYKDVFYFFNPTIKLADAGNLTERLALKARCPNKIKTFFDKGYPELGDPNGRNVVATGDLRCSALKTFVLWWGDPWTYGLRLSTDRTQEQVFLTDGGALRTELAQFTGFQKDMKFSSHTVFMEPDVPDIQWVHRKDGLLKAVPFDGCLVCRRDAEDSKNNKARVELAPCNANDPHQQWSFRNYTQSYTDIQEGKLTGSDYLVQYHNFLRG